MLILAGCGGSGEAKPQTVRGEGYRFSAPSGWTVKHTAKTTAAEHGRVDRVEVTTFALVRPYRPRLFAAASKELDRLAAQLAGQLNGRLADDETIKVAGRDARRYRIEYGDKAQEITFVLRGRREYQLLCRRAMDGKDSACRQLVASFELA